MVLEIALIFYLQKFCWLSFRLSSDFFGCRSDSLPILLVVSFDDLSYRQENIRSKFNMVLPKF